MVQATINRKVQTCCLDHGELSICPWRFRSGFPKRPNLKASEGRSGEGLPPLSIPSPIALLGDRQRLKCCRPTSSPSPPPTESLNRKPKQITYRKLPTILSEFPKGSRGQERPNLQQTNQVMQLSCCGEL